MEHAYKGNLRPRSRPEFAISRDSHWIDVAFVALIFGALLFNIVLAQVSVLLVLTATGGMILLRWERIPQALASSWPLFSVPALCLASAAWSDVPTTTLYYAALYTVTALTGVLIGSALNRDAYIEGHFIAFAIFAICSALFGNFVIHQFSLAFAGLMASKNTMGDMAGVGMMATLAFVALKLHQRKMAAAGFAALLLPVFAIELYLTLATGALIATFGGTVLLVTFAVSRRLEIQVRSALLVTCVIMLVLAIATMQWWVEPVFDTMVEASGKDAGLTGRVDLWAVGERLISERPVAGLGYAGFWIRDNIDAEFLWAMMGISGRSGFNFHNTPMEIIIHLGYVGFTLACLMALYASVLLIYRSALVPHYSAIFACALLAFWSVKTPFEVIAFDPMHFNTVTIYAVFAMGLRMDRRKSPARRYRSR